MSDTESETGSEGSSSDPLIEEEYLVEDEDGEYSLSTTTSTGRLGEVEGRKNKYKEVT